MGALIIAGAVGGAIGAAAGYTVSNWGHLTWQGYAKSTAIGAVSGAAGAAIGYGVGKAVVGVLSFIVGEGVTYAGMESASTIARKVAEVPLTSSIKPISVYQAVDETGKVVYVGITNNIERRAGEHLATKGIAIEKIPGLDGLTKADARSVEQTLINHYGLGKEGGQLMNRINSIARNNPIYEGSLSRGREILTLASYALN